MLLSISDANILMDQVEVKGTVWLIAGMVQQQRITVAAARAALHRMRVNGRRLPWEAAAPRKG